MASKKYRGKLCVYCNRRPSGAGDHVFAREFFVQTARENLPQVPACERCNGDKSSLEHYLTAVLPFGGVHGDAQDNLAMVPGRLAKNAKLAHALHAGRTQIWHPESGIVRRTLTVPIQSDKVVALGKYLAQGLAWYHWSVRLSPEEDTTEAWLLSYVGRTLFDHLFAKNAANRVHQDLGRGTIHYDGVQSTDNPHLTLWRIHFYGGLKLAGDPDAPGEVAGEIGVITGPKRLVTMLARSASA
jgi:hypothetical protein